MERFIKPWLPADVPNYTFIHANIVDVVKGSILSNSTVRLSNGRIKSIQSSPYSATPADGQIIDLASKFLLPGLIDSHVHLSATPGESDPSKMFRPDSTMTSFRIPYVCKDMLSRGFTTVRDCGGAPPSLKTAIAEWLIPGPRLLLAGHALTTNGGHGDFRDSHDLAPPECPTCGHFVGLARTVDGVPSALRKTRDELRQGADFIKVMGSGGSLGAGKNTREDTQFSPEEMRAITSVAAAAHTYVTVHAYTPESIRNAIDNGATGIEHGNLLDRPTARLMAEKGVYLTPTLVTFAMAADGPGASARDPAGREADRQAVAMGLLAITIAQEEGVQICFGSDLLGPVGGFQSREFGLRAQVQSPVEVLRSATVTPARMMGLEGEVGEVREGFAADLLVLRENPLEGLGGLEEKGGILAVLKGGRVAFSGLGGLEGMF